MEGVSPPGPDPARLEQRLREMGRVLVAFSGGVDSAVVAAAAYHALGGDALAVTLHGPAVAQEEVEMAQKAAATIGIAHRLVLVDPLKDPRYAANPVDRCYFCRAQEGGKLQEIAREEGFAGIVDGIHRDDLGDDRPGMRAMEERGVRHPLLESGLGKEEVRALARAWGLPNHDAPSNSCLASRVAHGELITVDTLTRVAAAERALRARGFRQVRVRTSHGSARVEVGAEEVARFADPVLKAHVEEEVLALGFHPVTIDPKGYLPVGARGRPPEGPPGPPPPSGGP